MESDSTGAEGIEPATPDFGNRCSANLATLLTNQAFAFHRGTCWLPILVVIGRFDVFWEGEAPAEPQSAQQELRPPVSVHRLSEPNSTIYSMILVTTPEPTVLPPSRIANRTPASIATVFCSSTVSLTLSPGMHISASTRLAVPVTSVVLK